MFKPKRSVIIGKFITLQIFFYLTSVYGPKGYGNVFFFIGLSLINLNFFFIKKIINPLPYFSLVLIFFFTGLLQDTILIHFGIIKMNSTYPPIWFPTLWMMFLGYYGDVFNKMLDFPIWLMSLLGAIGGSFAYYRGLSSINVLTHDSFYYIIALVWAVFMPFTLKYFKHFKLQKLEGSRG